MKITAYLKPVCGWSGGVRDVLAYYGLDYEEKLISEPENYAEMVARSGQPLSPCVKINDVMLADVGAEEVEEYLVSEALVSSELLTDIR